MPLPGKIVIPVRIDYGHVGQGPANLVMVEHDHVCTRFTRSLDGCSAVRSAVGSNDQLSSTPLEFTHVIGIAAIAFENAITATDLRPDAVLAHEDLEQGIQDGAIHVI